jgi:hypothetical protein
VNIIFYVTDEKAAEYLCVYHLLLAAQYFEATGTDFAAKLPGDEFSLPAMTAWVGTMEALYPKD